MIDIFSYKKSRDIFYGFAEVSRLDVALKNGYSFEVTYVDRWISNKTLLKIINNYAHKHKKRIEIATIADINMDNIDRSKSEDIYIIYVHSYIWGRLDELRETTLTKGKLPKYVIYVPITDTLLTPPDISISDIKCEVLKME